jgi:hypothetical protein
MLKRLGNHIARGLSVRFSSARIENMASPFFSYYKRVCKQFGSDVRKDVAGTVVAIVVAIFAAILQMRYKLILPEQTWSTAIANAVPFVGVLLVYLLYHAARAPWKIHTEMELSLLKCDGRLRAIQEKVNTARPEITARWVLKGVAILGLREDMQQQTGLNRFHLMLQNNGQAVAVNISALPMTLQMPEQDLPERTQGTDQGAKAGVPNTLPSHAPTTWQIQFGSIDKLCDGGEEQDLEYRITPSAGLFQEDISDVLKYLIDRDAHALAPLTLVFSDTGEPTRTWHAHYKVSFSYRVKREHRRLKSVFGGFGEVDGAGNCSRCLED